jgi:pimeloyl-ACP methyl ester carboxylesterase
MRLIDFQERHMQTEKSFDSGELIVNYFEGPVSGPPLVLLHGMTGVWQAWYPMLAELMSQWHVYAPDLRGHGKSGRAPDNQYHNADYARDVIAFLKHIDEPAVLMGHSLGAMVSIVAASEYPAGVRGIVLLDPPLFTAVDSVRLHQDSTNWFQLVSSVMNDSPSYETVFDRLQARMPATDKESLTTMAHVMVGNAANTVDTALRDEIWQGVDLPQALQNIECPILLIHGDWDHGAAMRDEDITSFRVNCPSATIIRIPDANHNIPQEHADVVLEQLKTLFPTP